MHSALRTCFQISYLLSCFWRLIYHCMFYYCIVRPEIPHTASTSLSPSEPRRPGRAVPCSHQMWAPLLPSRKGSLPSCSLYTWSPAWLPLKPATSFKQAYPIPPEELGFILPPVPTKPAFLSLHWLMMFPSHSQAMLSPCDGHVFGSRCHLP